MRKRTELPKEARAIGAAAPSSDVDATSGFQFGQVSTSLVNGSDDV